MLYFLKTEATAHNPATVQVIGDRCPPELQWVAINRNNFPTFEYAQTIAALAGDAYMATDAGDHVHPRYDVVAKPCIGDDVSRHFNGDFYPAGQIVKISDKDSRRVHTSDGTVFCRRGLSGRWIAMGGTWGMVHGHHTDKNPHF